MNSMIFWCLGVDEDVIQEHHDKVIQVVGKYVIHQVHKLRRGVGYTKWYNQKFLQAPTSFERYFRYIFFA